MADRARNKTKPADGLFDSAAVDRLAERGPLASRMRPRTLDDIVGQRELVGPGAPLRVLIEEDRVTSAILWGPPGTGKTTLAAVIAHTTAKEFVQLSATSAGVADVRREIEAARLRLGEQGRGTILFIDEVHRFNKTQQDALLPAVEEGLVVFMGATTENPFFSVNGPLLSRATLWRLEPLSDDDIRELIRRAIEIEGATLTDSAVEALVSVAEGDARSALGTMEVALAISEGEGGGAAGHGAGERDRGGASAPVDASTVERARSGRLLHGGADAHYDRVSALIKSVRGSDADAGLYWLARMLESGEDARFLARRLVILASEDIGMADPLALVVADAAARAVEFVGLPEAQLNLAHCVVYLSLAPKSNRVTVALSRAQEDVRRGPSVEVPPHLRDRHYPGARVLGHGEGYRYPHDDPRGWVEQSYLPEELAERRYYEPSEHGAEARFKKSESADDD